MNTSEKKPTIILLKGPTASGKTDLAVELAQRLPLEIISVDSALVYRGMDIVTSKPDMETLASAPHRLVDICEPTEAYSAAQFRHDALKEIESILALGKTPLLVGGTMLYFKALVEGLSTLPAADEGVRQELERELSERGLTALHKELSRVDPEAGERIHQNDPQRILRALEVYRLTGKSMTYWWQQQEQQALPYDIINLGLMPGDRSVLHERIARRFMQMLKSGGIEEVEQLRAREGMSLDLPSMRSVGYRQIWHFLDGEYDYDAMQEKGIVATRQLAKRQMTWMRSDQTLELLDIEDSNLVERVLKSFHLSHIY